jgi:acetylornithine deacetylase/succinyl-diaminopimelate desuccinylase family protein
MKPEIRLLRELIAIPSINPAFQMGPNPGPGEQNLADFIAATAATVGLTINLTPVHPNRPNLLAILHPKKETRHRVLLVPHLDTVGVQSASQLNPLLKNGKLHGRGACDTKGCIAAMLTALIRTSRNRRRPSHTEIILATTVDEENGQSGSRALAQSSLQADLAIIGEPTLNRVVTAHKGNLWLEIETRGKAAHGCKPHLGRNAIHAMARVVEQLEGPYARQLKETRHPLLGHPTINVGTIQGGRQPNIVPDSCTITIDRRTLPGETDRAVRQQIRQAITQANARARIVPVRSVPCPALETPHQQPFIQSLMQLARQRQPLGVDYFCDAAVLAASGIPSIVFGPGNIAQAHTRDEWIDTCQLTEATDLLSTYLTSLP